MGRGGAAPLRSQPMQRAAAGLGQGRELEGRRRNRRALAPAEAGRRRRRRPSSRRRPPRPGGGEGRGGGSQARRGGRGLLGPDVRDVAEATAAGTLAWASSVAPWRRWGGDGCEGWR